MKKLIALTLATAALLSMTGCSKEALDNVSTMIEAGGRDYGDTITNEIGETQKNTFFSTTVNSVDFVNEVGEYYLDDGYEFACVNVTVENIYNMTIPMGYGDFYIKWGEGENDWDGATYKSDLADDIYGEMFDLEKDEDYTATLYFAVPADRSGDLQLVYEELYDDDFVGSTYIINLE